jgi:hypothetical protein
LTIIYPALSPPARPNFVPPAALPDNLQMFAMSGISGNSGFQIHFTMEGQGCRTCPRLPNGNSTFRGRSTATSQQKKRREHNGEMAIFSCGQYRDEVVFEGQTPLLRRRHVLFDSRAIATLLAYPL